MYETIMIKNDGNPCFVICIQYHLWDHIRVTPILGINYELLMIHFNKIYTSWFLSNSKHIMYDQIKKQLQKKNNFFPRGYHVSVNIGYIITIQNQQLLLFVLIISSN